MFFIPCYVLWRVISTNLTKEKMKKLFKTVVNLMGFYLRYRFLITEDIIELKITPNSNNEDEINWVVDNDEYGISSLIFSLETLIQKNEM